MANGLIIIHKPQDWTSMDVCAKLRGAFHEKRVGHAGTLDPMATGVLPVFVGRCTRAVQFAETGEKEYIAGLRLGLTTNTQDTSGQILEEHPVQVSREELEAVLGRFRGEIGQVPPMYSAVKIGGKKLYELARKGVEVERKERRVTIHALELAEGLTPAFTPLPIGPAELSGHYFLRVRCSKGTYIRTLCHDIGQALGCGGCMSALLRSSACGFSLTEALPLHAVIESSDPEALLRPVDALFQDRPALTANAEQAQRLRHGNPIPWQGKDGEYRVYGPQGEFLLLGELKRGRLTTIKSFFEV